MPTQQSNRLELPKRPFLLESSAVYSTLSIKALKVNMLHLLLYFWLKMKRRPHFSRVGASCCVAFWGWLLSLQVDISRRVLIVGGSPFATGTSSISSTASPR